MGERKKKGRASEDKDEAVVKTESDSGNDLKERQKKKLKIDVENSEIQENGIVDRTSCKVVIHNALKFLRKNELSQILEEWVEACSTEECPIKIFKSKKVPNTDFIKLTLESESMVEPFVSQMNKLKLKNRLGKVYYATKQKTEDEKNDKNENVDYSHDIRDVTTPYWKTDYKEQLEQKQINLIKNCIVKITSELKKNFKKRDKEAKRNKHVVTYDVFKWLQTKNSITLEEVIPSPSIYEYRNKVEFTFGFDTDSKPSCGFLGKGWNGGVSKPHACAHTPREACGIADILENFLQTSTLGVYHPKTREGIWRIASIRISRRLKQCMIIILHSPVAKAKKLHEEKKKLVKLLTSSTLPMPTMGYNIEKGYNLPQEPTPMKVTCIYFQEYAGLSTPPPEHPVKHAYGTKIFQEQLSKCKFNISPGAFFQVNTSCAELLYGVVVKHCIREKNKKTILLDVCCGTGTIGLTCLKEGAVDQVIGVDISEPAIRDAKINAENNGFTEEKAKFVAGRAEAVLLPEIEALLEKLDSETNIIAVVDPARDGLHQKVIKALRETEEIQRVIYVSCNPTGSLIKDAPMLCNFPTKKYAGQPYKPVIAQAVDMFPFTNHVEFVMIFDRLTEDEFCLEEYIEKKRKSEEEKDEKMEEENNDKKMEGEKCEDKDEEMSEKNDEKVDLKGNKSKEEEEVNKVEDGKEMSEKEEVDKNDELKTEEMKDEKEDKVEEKKQVGKSRRTRKKRKSKK